MTIKKNRNKISPEIAAKTLFCSDRTCCVCRTPGKPVQIHHIDENPSNSSISNLAVLCFECHRETQIRGGFDRKLDAEQVILYRDDWNKIVSFRRAKYESVTSQLKIGDDKKLEVVTSLSEIYRENREYGMLAHHYDSIGNEELRDKYIEMAIENNPSDYDIIDLRSLQGKPELIGSETIEREYSRYTKNRDWSQRARFYIRIGKRLEAAKDYIRTVYNSLRKNNIFSAAFYLKEMIEEGLDEYLFIEAFRKAKEKDDLWLQTRALEELNWGSELDQLMLDNEAAIEKSNNVLLMRNLAKARGNEEEAIEIYKGFVKSLKSLGGGIVSAPLQKKKQQQIALKNRPFEKPNHANSADAKSRAAD